VAKGCHCIIEIMKGRTGVTNAGIEMLSGVGETYDDKLRHLHGHVRHAT